MLDDRNTTPGSLPAELLAWNYDNNYTDWVTLLGDALGADDVPPVASPARLTNFAGLAPANIEVGDLDIFKDESIAYALGLAKAGVPIELHVHPGAPHGFERFVPDAGVARRAMADESAPPPPSEATPSGPGREGQRFLALGSGVVAERHLVSPRVEACP